MSNGLITVTSNTPETGHLSRIDRANLSRYIVSVVFTPPSCRINRPVVMLDFGI